LQVNEQPGVKEVSTKPIKAEGTKLFSEFYICH